MLILFAFTYDLIIGNVVTVYSINLGLTIIRNQIIDWPTPNHE